MHTGYKNQKGFMVNLGLEPKTNSLSWWEKTKIYNKDQDSSLQGLENFSKHGTKYLATKLANKEAHAKTKNLSSQPRG